MLVGIKFVIHRTSHSQRANEDFQGYMAVLPGMTLGQLGFCRAPQTMEFAYFRSRASQTVENAPYPSFPTT